MAFLGRPVSIDDKETPKLDGLGSLSSSRRLFFAIAAGTMIACPARNILAPTAGI